MPPVRQRPSFRVSPVFISESTRLPQDVTKDTCVCSGVWTPGNTVGGRGELWFCALVSELLPPLHRCRYRANLLQTVLFFFLFTPCFGDIHVSYLDLTYLVQALTKKSPLWKIPCITNVHLHSLSEKLSFQRIVKGSPNPEAIFKHLSTQLMLAWSHPYSLILQNGLFKNKFRQPAKDQISQNSSMGKLRSHWKLMADERGESVSLVCEHWWMAHRHAHKDNTNWTQQDKKKKAARRQEVRRELMGWKV